MNWFGVMPAIITPFDSKLAVDHAFLAQHATWLLDNGCTGLVMLGSLGEGATLEHAEKIAVLKTAVQVSSRKKTPVVAAISALNLPCRGARSRSRTGWLRWPDGPPALRLHLRLARDEASRRSRQRRRSGLGSRPGQRLPSRVR